MQNVKDKQPTGMIGTTWEDAEDAKLQLYEDGYLRPLLMKDVPFGKEYYRYGHKRMNAVAIGVMLFIPWALFTYTFLVLAFHIRYESPGLCAVLVALPLLLGIILSCVGLVQYLTMKFHEELEYIEYEPNWYFFFGTTTILAFFAAVVIGTNTYNTYSVPYYDLKNLATYTDIDTTAYNGDLLMDAGTIVFAKGTKVDVGKSMAFKDENLFCVAPIVTNLAGANATDAKQETYDFWAIGKNCCSGYQPDFNCEDVMNTRARGAVRLLVDTDRPFYRLAVQQAEANYKIKAKHPLFFTWEEDPLGKQEDMMLRCRINFYKWSFTYFVFQLFLVLAATLWYAQNSPRWY